MASLASINIKFSADLKEFQTQLQSAQKSLEKTGKNLQKIGANLTASVTLPLAGLGALAVSAAADMETLKTSLDTVFQGDKAASNKAFEEIKEFAATTPFQLEEVATAFIKLKNLGLDPSLEALTSYGNTASALGKSLDQMIEAVADASVGEFERLKEFGIKAKSQGDNVAFTFQGVTTTVGKNSEEISKYLQDIGNVNFAGSIERQANTFTGRLSTLKDNISQAFAGIGEIIIEYITPLFDKLNGIIQKFQELSPETKKWIVILGGIAAALGPLLALAGTILPAIGAGLALLTGPIGLIIAGLTAVGVIIYKNWAPIKKTLIDIANYFIDLYNESTLFRIGVEAVINVFKNLWEAGKFVFEALKSILSGFVDSFVTGFKSIGEIIKAVFTGNIKALPGIVLNAVNESKKNLGNLTDNLGKDFDALWNGIKKNGTEALDAITKNKKLEYIKENVNATAITEAVSDATKKGLAEGASGTTGRAQIKGLDLTGLAKATTPLTTTPLTGMVEAMPEQVQALNEQQLIALDNALQFQEGFASIMDNTAVTFAEGFGELLGNFAAGNVSFGDLSKLMLTTLGDMAIQLGKLAIQIGIGVGAIKKALSSLNPAVAIAAGIALVALGTLVKSSVSKIGGGKTQAFANGGIVGGTSFYGDKILARVNSGELILNQDQQRKLYGMLQTGSGDIVTTTRQVIEGDKLILITERAQKRKNRLG